MSSSDQFVMKRRLVFPDRVLNHGRETLGIKSNRQPSFPRIHNHKRKQRLFSTLPRTSHSSLTMIVDNLPASPLIPHHLALI
jgi:hypothetical protein